MDKNKSLSKKTARIRGSIQAAATLLTNIHIPNLFKGKIYQGKAKTVCVPGLNCYSCPAATGACPIGAFQAVVGSSKFKFSYYITGHFNRCDPRKIYMWIFVSIWMVSGSASQNSRKKVFHSQAETTKIPEIYNPYCFRYTPADACNELHRNGRPVLL